MTVRLVLNSAVTYQAHSWPHVAVIQIWLDSTPLLMMTQQMMGQIDKNLVKVRPDMHVAC